MKRHFFKPEHTLPRTAVLRDIRRTGTPPTAELQEPGTRLNRVLTAAFIRLSGTLRPVFTLLLAGALLAGCTKDPEQPTGEQLMCLELGMSLAEPGVAQAASSTPRTQAAPATRASKVSSALPNGIEVLVEVYASGADITTATPIAQGTYIQHGTTVGHTIPKTDDDRIILRTGAYDFYFICPATPHTAGTVAVTGGMDFMTLRQSVTVTADPSGVFQLSATLVRRCAMLDVEVYFETGAQVTSLEFISEEPLTVAGLADAADIPIDPATGFTATGTGYTATYKATRFSQITYTDNGANFEGLSTYSSGTHNGIPVLPGTFATLNAHAMLRLNGSRVKEVLSELRDVTLEAGKYYVLRLKLDSRLGKVLRSDVSVVDHNGDAHIVAADEHPLTARLIP